jgi:hypothetical protein
LNFLPFPRPPTSTVPNWHCTWEIRAGFLLANGIKGDGKIEDYPNDKVLDIFIIIHNLVLCQLSADFCENV